MHKITYHEPLRCISPGRIQLRKGFRMGWWGGSVVLFAGRRAYNNNPARFAPLIVKTCIICLSAARKRLPFGISSKDGILPYVMRVYFSPSQRYYLELLVPVLTVSPSTTS